MRIAPTAMKLVLLDRLFSECRNLFLGLSLILRKGHPFTNDFSTRFVVIHVCGSLANLIYSEHARAFGRESTDFTELVLPALTLSLLAVAPLARASRAAMLDVLSSDFVRTARAIPLSRAKVLFVYAFGKALPPVLTTIGMVFSLMQLARSVPNAAACRRRIAPPHRRAGARRGGSALDCTL